MLYQDDDFGKDYLKGVRDGLGDKAKAMLVVEASYETTDPTVDSQIVSMKAAGCDVIVNTAIQKFAAQAIRKAAEIEWKPLHILSGIGSSVAGTLKPAGFENCKDIVSDFFLKDPTDPAWKDDPGYKWWVGFMDKYYPAGDKLDGSNAYAPSVAATVVQVLKQCGDELTRENVMKQAASLHDFTVPMLLPGMKINTSPTDFAPVKQVQMGRFDGAEMGAVRPADHRRGHLRPTRPSPATRIWNSRSWCTGRNPRCGSAPPRRIWDIAAGAARQAQERSRAVVPHRG